MTESTHTEAGTGRTGAEVEEEIHELSSELARTKRPAQSAAPPDRDRSGPLDSPWLAGVLLLIAVSLTAANIAGLGLLAGGTEEPMVPETAEPVRDTLLFAVEEVEAYRDDHGRLPQSLRDVGLSGELGVSLSRLGGDRYAITVTVGERTMSYSSTEDPRAVFGDLWSADVEERP